MGDSAHNESKKPAKKDPTPASRSRVKALVMTAPTVLIDGNSFTLTASATAYKTLTLKYWQIAVRGPGARDIAFHPGTKIVTGNNLLITGTGTAQAGDFTAFAAYSIDGVHWTNGPTVAFAIEGAKPKPPLRPDGPGDTPIVSGGARAIPQVWKKFSKLGFNSIVFRGDPAGAEQFGARRGTPVDGLLTFASRGTWNNLRWGFDQYTDYLAAGKLVVVSIPHAPESEGDQMNARGADDAYRDEQRELGAFYKDQGYNCENGVLRVDWECNGDWYHWSANRPGGAAALREALKNCVTNLRAGGLTQTRFDLCYNKGPSQSGADFEINPGGEYFDNISVDQYDMWSPAYNDSDWEREMAKPPSVRTTAQEAARHGQSWALDEGGNTHGEPNQGGDNQGGDNPYYWTAMRKEIDRSGAIAPIGWHNTYDHEGAPGWLHHDFDSNPASFAVYKRLWSPR
jgi:hypothetical protein